MASALQLVAASIGAICAGLWAYVGIALLQRKYPPEHRPAARCFALAWIAASLFATTNASVALDDAFGVSSSAVGLATAWISVVCAVAMFAGVVAYLAYLLTGSRAAVPIVLALYAAQLVVLVVFLASLHPVGITTTQGTVRFDFDVASDAYNERAALFFLVPAAAASVAYAALWWRIEGATAKWRLGLVAAALNLWVVVAIVARLTGVPTSLVLAARLFGALAAVLVFFAYAPPRWAQRRFGVETLHGEVVAPPADHEALAQRARDLV